MTDEDYPSWCRRTSHQGGPGRGQQDPAGDVSHGAGTDGSTWDGKDIQMMPMNIMTAAHPQRQDTAPEKRVELHLHTKMSNMDALTDTGDAVKTAIRWGHPAIAIMDHGVVQSFPDATKAAKGKIKILGHGGLLHQQSGRPHRRPRQGRCPSGGGHRLLRHRDHRPQCHPEEVTEIAPWCWNGEVCERFQTLWTRDGSCRQRSSGLTGITDEMLKGAPQPAEGPCGPFWTLWMDFTWPPTTRSSTSASSGRLPQGGL